ncbi:putative D-amino acid oxidase [Halopseudomonas oceani]|uniref:Glycine oxidase ThiO n=1 Tax=Halopseudomonas oceani TaxID=1708783 RepID=A0A2P4EY33_9GAMM|nr:glycine oxidase ThiO [Halopseudomonas oceani]POB05123.1 glycine oxidase ThiO [Halopseudomonas oceani]GGE33311.1 putative D-amino acid oxidase [Halopseudomonas oceani]
MHDVVLVGGGVMGCLSALELLHAGCRVTLLERGELGREASWAGGGIVSPLYPWRYCEAVSALADWSQGYYPPLADTLLAQTGLDPEVHDCGLLWLDHDEQDQALGWAAAHDKPLQRVDTDFIYRQVPQLASGYSGALWQAGLANVRNPRLMQSLRARLSQFEHFVLHEHCAVDSLLQEGDAVVGVQCPAGRIEADAVVLCAGAWSGDWLGQAGLSLPVEPVKGQMLLYKMAPGWLPSMVMAQGRYAIPRRDGHILIGSTLEYEGYDKRTTEQALASLQASAEALLPDLARQSPVAQWAGLRPGSPDGVPYIGPVSSLPGLWLNAGHFRNGLVLAPASCRLLVDLMLDRTPEIDPAPYLPDARLR